MEWTRSDIGGEQDVSLRRGGTGNPLIYIPHLHQHMGLNHDFKKQIENIWSRWKVIVHWLTRQSLKP